MDFFQNIMVIVIIDVEHSSNFLLDNKLVDFIVTSKLKFPHG